MNSGIFCVVLRVGKTEGVDEILASESSVVVGAQQSLPPGSVITKGQASSVSSRHACYLPIGRAEGLGFDCFFVLFAGCPSCGPGVEAGSG